MIMTSKIFYAWRTCLLASLFLFYEFVQMNMFNSLSKELMRDFNINAVSLGYFSSTYFIADALFAVPASLFLNYFSPRKIILFTLSLCTMCTFLLALTTSFSVALICHFLSGIGNAFCFLCCMLLASRWFPFNKMALVVGVIVTIAMTGGIVAQLPVTKLVLEIGWRYTVLAIGILGIFIFAIIWCYVEDYPSEKKNYYLQQKKELKLFGLWGSLKLAWKNKQNWLAGIYTCLMNLPLVLLGALWGNLYLTQAHQLTASQASKVSSMLFLGTILGCPIIGRISDRVRSRRIPMIVGAIISLIIICLVFKLNISFNLLLILFLCLGFTTSTQIISYPLIAESNPEMLTSIAYGPSSILIMGGAALFQPIFGKIMDLYWKGNVSDTVHIYPPEAFKVAIFIFPIAFIIALLTAFFIKDTYCKNIYSNHKLN